MTAALWSRGGGWARIGAWNARGYAVIADRFEVVAICDINAERARSVAQEQNVPRVVMDVAELSRMDELDVIDLCTPPYLHFEHIQQGA